ncbi:MAG TPA: hypothetical protein VNH18_21245 [Bryobacteraceae bacterium]|nr:hypothetical protein [Bryobacteraceae bacterium]
MKALLTLTFALAGLACGQTQTINISISGVSPAVIADVATHWKDQAGPSIGTITFDISDTDTIITIDQAALSAAPTMPRVGDTVMIASEPCTVTEIADKVLTLDRGKFDTARPSTHPAGSTVTVMKYRTAYEMMIAEWFLPGVQSIMNQLGPRSATLGARITGSITQ